MLKVECLFSRGFKRVEWHLSETMYRWCTKHINIFSTLGTSALQSIQAFAVTFTMFSIQPVFHNFHRTREGRHYCKSQICLLHLKYHDIIQNIVGHIFSKFILLMTVLVMLTTSYTYWQIVILIDKTGILVLSWYICFHSQLSRVNCTLHTKL